MLTPQVDIETGPETIRYLYDQRDKFSIKNVKEKQDLAPIMPQFTNEWHKKNNYSVDNTLLIEHFGMEAIFIKLPNFEPLLEQYVAEKKIL